MTAVMAREAFGAEFVGAEGFLNSPTYGLPPRFLMDALQDDITLWQAGTMEASSFDEPVRAGRAGYAALTGVPVDSVAMGGNVSAMLGLVAAAVPDGSRVATLAGEFTSATFPFAAQVGRGVTITELAPGELVSAAADFDVVTASRTAPRSRRTPSGWPIGRAQNSVCPSRIRPSCRYRLQMWRPSCGLPVFAPRRVPGRCASASTCTTPRTTWTGCSTLWGITASRSWVAALTTSLGARAILKVPRKAG